MQIVSRTTALEPWRSDPRWKPVEAVLESQGFRKSARLRAFLHYVCSRELSGRTAEITEQQIGIHVFEREPGYNPGEDNIVRNAARQLRQRLAVYYQEEDPTAEVRIEIPKGGYVPVFCPGVIPVAETVSPELTLSEAPLEAAPAPEISPARRLPLREIGIFLVGIGCCLAGILLIPMIGQPSGPTDRFWRQFLRADQPALLVVGDAGLNMFDNLAREQVTIDSYIYGQFLSSPHAQTPPGYTWSPFARRRYTSVADVRFTEQLFRQRQMDPRRFQVRYARDIRVDDLKTNNVILSGAATYNPWVQLFDKDRNFHVDYVGANNTIVVSNRSPKRGEEKQYIWASGDPSHRGYVVIAVTRNLSGAGLVMMVEGTTMAGVDAGIDFLTSEERLSDFLRRNIAPDHFEVLLEATVVEGNSPAGKVLAYR